MRTAKELLAAFLLAASLILYVGQGRAAPVAEAGGEGLRVLLTDEPCAVSAVANLKQRATWTEKGTTYEGCWSAARGLVLMYFAQDRSVVAIPVEAFSRVQGV